LALQIFHIKFCLTQIPTDSSDVLLEYLVHMCLEHNYTKSGHVPCIYLHLSLIFRTALLLSSFI
jgi:hypothetical protein